jgi:sugar phosphate isomerase/epimerase
MKTINRRSFIQQSAYAAGAAVALSQLPKSLFASAAAVDIPIGFQTWVVRDQLSKDFAGTLKNMAAEGYQLVEMCSPKGYEKAGFGPLVSMKSEDMRKTISDAGLKCPSCHFGFSELNNNLDDRIEFAHALGMSVMICSSFGLPEKSTLSDYQEAADKLNKAGEKIKKEGLQAGYHNHSGEFATLDGQLIYDVLMKRFDPELVKMQFQTEVITLGYKAADYFNKYPGRFISSHLSDWTADKKAVPIGQGVINWKEFFAAAQTGGVKYFYVEMEPETLKDSATYIKGLIV